MTTLFSAINSSATTHNGGVTNASSLNKNTDFFFLAGASRGKDITATFAAALAENSEIAVRILQWVRDARNGAGERDTFRKLFGYLVRSEPTLAKRILAKIPMLGRWDDLEIAFGTSHERDALRMISAGFKDPSVQGLCAKWMPRQGPVANKIRSYLQLTPKQYRKLLVGLSTTVEQKMCADKWADIEYSHVPSVASSRYQKAFLKHDPVGYGAYKTKLTSGEAKINASVSYPYEVIRAMRNGDATVANAQWDALPNYLEGSDENILPVVDVSASMTWVKVSGEITPLDVAISLGLYTSERMGGTFKNQFVTFSTSPVMIETKGTLLHRYSQMQDAPVGGSTNIQSVFRTILKAATKHKVAEAEMPTKILILSDMEFNSCTDSASRSVSGMDMIRSEYRAAGYKLPQVIFWNLNARAGNCPVTYNETGTALVSGFSPSICRSVLGGEDMTPYNVMLKTILVDRYDY